MFNDEDLIAHLDSTQALEVDAGCFAEINQNDPTNIDLVGTFKYGEYPNVLFTTWTGNSNTYYKLDSLTTDMRKSTNDDDVLFFGNRPKTDYFSLADCFTDFRPRSGIVKAVQPFGKDQVYVDNFLSVRRPRYYIPSVKDEFKYWTSWNTDINPSLNIGLSENDRTIRNAAPFAIFKEAVAANMLTVKIQTGNGEPANRSFASSGNDPLSNPQKSNLPQQWRVDYLDTQDTWQTAMRFDNYDPEILDPTTGNVDLVYMISNPHPARFPNFLLKGYIDSPAHLPYIGRLGEAFVIGRSATNIGSVVIWTGTEWEGAAYLEGDLTAAKPTDLKFEWRILDYEMNPEEYAVTNFIDPTYYNPTPGGDMGNDYTGFLLMKGVRIVVEKMLTARRPFDLIELSPRLFCNLSKNTVGYQVSKAISEESALPVGEMSVSHGTVTMSNLDLILNRESKFDPITAKGSILSGRVRRNTKFRFYEIIKNVPSGGLLWDKFVPVKTFYAMDKPTVVSGSDDIQIELRDLTFLFEEKKAPNLVLKNTSLTKAVAVLCDYIGFSNYIFHLGPKENYSGETSPLDSIIPYFFVNESMSVAEALEALAIATQCAMFFDENNNFVVMPREHFGTDPEYTFRGRGTSSERTNIEDVEDIQTQLISDVEITFTHRDIARERILNYRQSNPNASTTQGESANVLGYKINPLWDASKLESSVLGVGVLRTLLTSDTPVYDPSALGSFRNNYFDIGMWAEFFPEFKGYVMMNGEIIRYDAKQYSVGGRNVWITSSQHLEEVVGRSEFKQTNGSGQMIYPTGLMRIFTELAEDEQGHTSLVGHGRGMFGTPITSHTAEPTEWVSGPTYHHTDTAVDTVFGVVAPENYNYSRQATSSAKTSKAKVTNYIYNPMHSRNLATELNPINIDPSDVSLFSADRKIMRSSALTFGGPQNAKANEVFMKVKQIPGNGYTLYGTRIGIVGNTLNQEEQSPFGSMVLGEFKMNSDDAEMESVIGAGGGLVFGTSRNSTSGYQSDEGYYLEITALNSSYEVEQDGDDTLVVFSNVNFYKINHGTAVPTNLTDGNVAVKLWSTFMDIRVTSGSQMARDRLMTDYNLVYDLAVEVKEQSTTKGTLKTFYIYVNDMIVGLVEDLNTISGANGAKVYHPETYSDSEVGVFVRGGSTIQVEHIYAVGTDKFNESPITIDSKVYKRPRSFKIFSPSAIWATAALTGGKQNLYRYYEEFGSMARECKRIDAKFDLFPALKSKIAKRPIFDKSYSVTHYTADPYSASMMVWAQSDRSIRLTDDMTLDLQGITLADNESQTLRLDDFLTGKTDGASELLTYNKGIQLRNNLLASRAAGATDLLELDSMYIQNRDTAEKMFRWLIGFVGVEKIKLRLTMFGIPHVQIGDIVTVDYDFPTRIGESVDARTYSPDTEDYPVEMVNFSDNGKRFIVRAIDVTRTVDGPEYSVDVVELPDKDTWNAGEF